MSIFENFAGECCGISGNSFLIILIISAENMALEGVTILCAWKAIYQTVMFCSITASKLAFRPWSENQMYPEFIGLKKVSRGLLWLFTLDLTVNFLTIFPFSPLFPYVFYVWPNSCCCVYCRINP